MLDWIEIWRIRRQVEEFASRIFNDLPCGIGGMESGVIHNDCLSRSELGNKVSFKPAVKDYSIGIALEYEWCSHLLLIKCGNNAIALLTATVDKAKSAGSSF